MSKSKQVHNPYLDIIKKNKGKIACYDIETSNLVIKTWSIWETNSIGAGKGVIEDYQILCFAFKYLGDKKTYVVAQPNFSDYVPGVNDDKHVVETLHALMDNCEAMLGHNSRSFDNKKSQARMIYHKLSPPSPYQTIDTKTVAKRHFAFTSNKLSDLADYFGVEAKGDPGGMET